MRKQWKIGVALCLVMVLLFGCNGNKGKDARMVTDAFLQALQNHNVAVAQEYSLWEKEELELYQVTEEDYIAGIRNRSDISASLCTVNDMDRVADARRDDLGLDVVHHKDLGDLVDQVDTRHGDVVQSAQERGNVGCSCSCSQQSLCCGKDQSYVGLNALCVQNLNSL